MTVCDEFASMCVWFRPRWCNAVDHVSKLSADVAFCNKHMYGSHMCMHVFVQVCTSEQLCTLYIYIYICIYIYHMTKCLHNYSVSRSSHRRAQGENSHIHTYAHSCIHQYMLTYFQI
jgi:hypothetical protein